MKREISIFLLLIIMILGFLFINNRYSNTTPVKIDSYNNLVKATDELRIINGVGEEYKFRIAIADDDASRARGLMFVKEMPKNSGMLFYYNKTKKIYMWMKNTFIPLDMIFIDKGGEIKRIIKNTEPQSLKTLSSKVPVFGVLELNAGVCDDYNIRVGDKVFHEYFEN